MPDPMKAALAEIWDVANDLRLLAGREPDLTHWHETLDLVRLRVRCLHVAAQLRDRADMEFDHGHPVMGSFLRDRADELDAGLTTDE